MAETPKPKVAKPTAAVSRPDDDVGSDALAATASGVLGGGDSSSSGDRNGGGSGGGGAGAIGGDSAGEGGEVGPEDGGGGNGGGGSGVGEGGGVKGGLPGGEGGEFGSGGTGGTGGGGGGGKAGGNGTAACKLPRVKWVCCRSHGEVHRSPSSQVAVHSDATSTSLPMLCLVPCLAGHGTPRPCTLPATRGSKAVTVTRETFSGE